jgi:hypothetical protein
VNADEYLVSQLKQQDSKWSFVESWPYSQVLSLCRFAEEYHEVLTPHNAGNAADMASTKGV